MVDLVERKFSSAQFKKLIIDRFDPSTSYVHIYIYIETHQEKRTRGKNTCFVVALLTLTNMYLLQIMN